MTGWVSCRDNLPDNQPGLWSEPVAAISDLGFVFRLSCMGGYWQRSKEFINSGSREITHWIALPKD